MIKINVVHGNAFVWNANDVRVLREKHRIVGKCVGCLPRSPYQNKFLGLPLQLMREEATLLVEKGIACFVEYPRLKRKRCQSEQEEFVKFREKSYQEQVELGKEERKSMIIARADLIVKGKLKKLTKLSESSQEIQEMDPDLIIQKEIEKIQPIPQSAAMIEIFTESPWLDEDVEANWKFPENIDEKLRYETFKSFWDEGYFLTSGIKFGGDFLVYSGDPHSNHAQYIISCRHDQNPLTMLDIISKGRLAASVKKTFLLCFFNDDGKISRISLQWPNASTS